MKSMDKNSIKIKLKEAIAMYIVLAEAKRYKTNGKGKSKFRKADNKPKSQPNDEKGGEKGGQDGQRRNDKKDYADVQRAFKRLGGPSMVDIMVMIGIPDDKTGTNRSLFRKKVLQKKNKDTGSYYQFDDEELDKVRAAIDSQKG
jgi:hypothetical protein